MKPARERIPKIHKLLSERYGDFAHHNKSNPLDELLFIICSVKTAKKGYHASYLALKKAFPTYSKLAQASEKRIAQVLFKGGLSNEKASAIEDILGRLVSEFGRPTLAPLAKMSDEDCERFLASLPYVGTKVARCVMMYSLKRRVFPVDTHCWRLSLRLGLIRPHYRSGRMIPSDEDRLQSLIPPDLRFSLHVNMVSHGRLVCTAAKPSCHSCVLSALCPKRGVQRAGRRPRPWHGDESIQPLFL